MNMRRMTSMRQNQIGRGLSLLGDSVPKPLGFTAFSARMAVLCLGQLAPPRHACVRYRMPAAGSALGSHPCVALSSTQVRPV
jgi:hypothetical protein